MMKKIERYEKAVSYIAFRLLKESTPEATCSTVILEDITARTEKTFIKKLKIKIEGNLETKKGFEMDTKKDEKMIQILNSRMNRLEMV